MHTLHLSFFFFTRLDWLASPVRIFEASSEQPVNLLAKILVSLHIHLPRLLLHWPDLDVDGELLVDDGGVDAWHVSGSLCEHIQVVGEELFEHDLLVSGKPHSNLESSFRMQRVYME